MVCGTETTARELQGDSLPTNITLRGGSVLCANERHTLCSFGGYLLKDNSLGCCSEQQFARPLKIPRYLIGTPPEVGDQTRICILISVNILGKLCVVLARFWGV